MKLFRTNGVFDAILDSILLSLLVLLLLDVAFVALAFGLFRLAHVDLARTEIRGQFQDVFSGVLGLVGVLVGSSFAAFAFVTQAEPNFTSTTAHRKRLKSLATALLGVVLQGLLLALVSLYLLAKVNLSDPSDQLVISSLVPLVPIFAVSFVVLVRDAVKMRLAMP